METFSQVTEENNRKTQILRFLKHYYLEEKVHLWSIIY